MAIEFSRCEVETNTSKVSLSQPFKKREKKILASEGLLGVREREKYHATTNPAIPRVSAAPQTPATPLPQDTSSTTFKTKVVTLLSVPLPLSNESGASNSKNERRRLISEKALSVNFLPPQAPRLNNSFLCNT